MPNTTHTLSDFDYHLPPELIAKTPVTPREAARLLCWPEDGAERTFADLPQLLGEGDVLVLNNTKVIPARLMCSRPREQQEGIVEVELLLHKPLGNMRTWEAFAKPAKRLKEGQVVTLANGTAARVLTRDGDRVSLEIDLDEARVFDVFDEVGQMPLPPYIERQSGATQADKEDYQTVFAQHKGSVAAPTAGLHFSDELLAQLKEKGVSIAYVTLHVGAGTFQPVRSENLDEHVMHSEWGEITAEAVAQIHAAKAAGGRVVAVGTTAMRVLESAAMLNGGTLAPWQGETDIFITPGYSFNVVEKLITNYHLPKSTLLMLVAAFIGFDEMKTLYKKAISDKYRFYSYGDGCLLTRKEL